MTENSPMLFIWLRATQTTISRTPQDRRTFLLVNNDISENTAGLDCGVLALVCIAASVFRVQCSGGGPRRPRGGEPGAVRPA
jgi:hypothetical protein